MSDLFDEKTKAFGFIGKDTIRINLLDDNSKHGVKYGLNWAFDPYTGELRIEKGKTESSRSGNEAYFQLPQEVYMSDFFPESDSFHVTDDLGNDFVFNRSQPKVKDGKPQALSTPESNKILGLYIRHRLGLKSGALITKSDLLNYGRTDIIFIKKGNNFFMDFSSDKTDTGYKKPLRSDSPLQRIFYGAPGTGKSYAIKKLTEGKNVIRTTFHPDSDYSTFVGAYKPTTKQVPVFSTYGEKAVAVKGTDGQPITEDRIIYEFVDQAFLQAYTNAWKLYAQAVKEGKQPEEQYLIIEEINRGNCAQIFGDLFQLLDRDEEGFSEYPIKADKDMRKYLDSVFTNMVFLNAPALCGMNSEETAVKIRKGEILVLPSNLYIWATMNTSDQSLFPIDSAFKRRWEWEYVPIHNCNKGWRIAVNNDEYDWWDFLEKINEQIGSTTNSEDKKLGYFFCKADNDGIISAEKFVSKVIFYLWNDVFKDFGFDSNIFKDEDGKELSFNKFYTTDADGNTAVQRDKVELFLKNLGIEVLNKEDNTGNNNE